MNTSVEMVVNRIVEWLLPISLDRWTLQLNIDDYRYCAREVSYPQFREIPELIGLLLKDQTTGRNIRWATDSHVEEGVSYAPDKPVRLNQVTKGNLSVVQTRASKAIEEQKDRTKVSAEVFTPTWVVKKQNDLIEEEFKGLPLEEYIGKTWLEITCGEGPYMCSRYDMVSGDTIEIDERVGFVDRKLQRIGREVSDGDEWMRLVVLAYQSSFGYEYQGDSLLLARENMLYTFVDYYYEQFGVVPELEEMVTIAEIISYNVFQMDGLKYIVPTTEIDTKIMDWEKNELFKFKRLLEECSYGKV